MAINTSLIRIRESDIFSGFYNAENDGSFVVIDEAIPEYQFLAHKHPETDPAKITTLVIKYLKRIGFQNLRTLGTKGISGDVLIAQIKDPKNRLAPEYVIKLIQPKYLNDIPHMIKWAGLGAVRGDQNLIRVGHHPNLLGVYGVITSDRDKFSLTVDISSRRPQLIYGLVTEAYPQAADLQTDLVKETEASGGATFHYSAYETQYIILCVLQALGHMHKGNCLHRDIKPANVLILRDLKTNEINGVKLIDLGFSKYTTERTYTICGSPAFIAPEVLFKTGYSKPADMWALGMFCFYVFCGQYPLQKNPFTMDASEFEGISHQARYLIYAKFYDLELGQCSEFVNLIELLLQSDPAKRPSAENALLHDFFTLSFAKPAPPKAPVGGQETMGVPASAAAAAESAIEEPSPKPCPGAGWAVQMDDYKRSDDSKKSSSETTSSTRTSHPLDPFIDFDYYTP